jgi:hypothetical protein
MLSPQPALANHDFTYHPKGGGWNTFAGGGICIHETSAGSTVMLNAQLRIDANGDGSVTTWASGVLRFGDVRPATFIAALGSSATACSEEGLSGFDLVFFDPASGEQARIAIVPLSGAISTAGLHR